MYKFRLLILPLSLFLMISCSSDTNTLSGTSDDLEMSTLSSDLPHDLSPEVPDSDISELVAGNNTFALNLYSRLAAEDGNVFFSPFSISQVCAMMYAGAEGSTASQMKETLHFPLSREKLHPAFNTLDLELESRSVPQDDFFDGDCFQLQSTNSLWGREAALFSTDFLDNLSVNYGTGMQILDFSQNPEDARVIINDWVGEQTKEKIVDILPQGSISSQTALVLINALYFKAPWDVSFLVEDTFTGKFTAIDGNQKEVSYMPQTMHYNYSSGDVFQALEIPYDGNKMSMLVILPEKGTLHEFETSLTAELYNSIISTMVLKKVCLTMPKFTVQGESISLKQCLSAMRMVDCFTGDADFSGMSESVQLSIDDILHKSFITVNEKGTEAAAASAGLIPATGNEQCVEFFADSPFIFMVRDMVTGTILFTGRMLDPAGN